MKKRDGFVSNSSSVSFCIYGASVSSEEGEELESLIGDLGLTSGCFQKMMNWLIIDINII